jgi:hypothetical protein
VLFWGIPIIDHYHFISDRIKAAITAAVIGASSQKQETRR